ncbi:MAG: hypothetical protein KAT58_11715 [candidate division Zixibacteria bacterium]|nr:hypothetical protein [candidate division Zixibacteria bacterium]
MSENTVPSGNHSKLKVTRGFLREYTNTDNALELHFEFNPSSITRTRAVEIKFGEGQAKTGGRDFHDASEVPRVTQGATVKAESFTVKILLDATDRMNAGDKDAQSKGVQPELDILYYMVEPKLQTPDGATTLAALGEGGSVCQSQPYPSVLEFHWGDQILPVLMTQLQFDVKAYLPSLLPYRAEATLTLQIIQSNNPFYTPEISRVFASTQKALGALQGFQDSGS